MLCEKQNKVPLQIYSQLPKGKMSNFVKLALFRARATKTRKIQIIIWIRKKFKIVVDQAHYACM